MSWFSSALGAIGDALGGSGAPRGLPTFDPSAPRSSVPTLTYPGSVPATTAPGSGDRTIFGWDPPDWLDNAYDAARWGWDAYQARQGTSATTPAPAGTYPAGAAPSSSSIPTEWVIAAVAVVLVLVIMKR